MNVQLERHSVNSPTIVTAKEARRSGLDFYFTGRPCPLGHVSIRRLKNAACVACEAAYRARHAEKIKALREKNRRKQKIWHAEWRANNQARILANRRSYYDANAEIIRTKVKKWRVSNPDKARASERNKRARLLSAKGSHHPDDISDIRRLQRDRCAEPNCRRKLRGKGHVDHIIPLARGGENGRRNLQLLCGSCNMRKHAKDPIAFARELGRLL